MTRDRTQARGLESVIRLFVRKGRRERLLQLLAAPKRHRTLVNEFHTSTIFAQDKMVEIPPNEQYAALILSRMQQLGAEDRCINVFDELNGTANLMALDEALESHVGFLTGTVLFCPTARVGYYEGGHAEDRWLLASR